MKAGETLSSIATAECSDARAVSSIYEVNRGRIQSDGDALVDADVIHEGWELVINCQVVELETRPVEQASDDPTMGSDPEREPAQSGTTVGRSDAAGSTDTIRTGGGGSTGTTGTTRSGEGGTTGTTRIGGGASTGTTSAPVGRTEPTPKPSPPGTIPRLAVPTSAITLRGQATATAPAWAPKAVAVTGDCLAQSTQALTGSAVIRAGETRMALNPLTYGWHYTLSASGFASEPTFRLVDAQKRELALTKASGLKLSPDLPPGSYEIVAQAGSQTGRLQVRIGPPKSLLLLKVSGARAFSLYGGQPAQPVAVYLMMKIGCSEVWQLWQVEPGIKTRDGNATVTIQTGGGAPGGTYCVIGSGQTVGEACESQELTV